MKADADGLAGPADLPVLAEVAYAAGHLDVAIEAWERAHALVVQAGDQLAAAGAAVRVAMHLLLDTALMAPVRGWLATRGAAARGSGRDVGARVGCGSPGVRANADGRPRRRSRVGRARRSRSAATHDPAACAIGRVAEARLLILARRCSAKASNCSTRWESLSSPATSIRSLQGLVYCELVCALQGLAQYEAAEEWTEAMERWCKDERHREHPRALPGPSCGDPEAARVVRRGRDRGARGVRGTTALPATRVGMAAERARDGSDLAKETSKARSKRCWPLISRVGSPARSRAGSSGPRRRRHRGGLHTRRARAPVAGAVEGAATEHRLATGAATRGAGRDRDRGRQHRPSPLSRRRIEACGVPIPEQGARRRRDPCSRKGAARRGRCRGRGSGSAPKLRGSGTRWARPMRRRLHDVALAEAHRAGGSEHQAGLELQAARTILERIEAGQTADPAAHIEEPRRSRRAARAQTATSFVARATIGRSCSRGARCACETSRACGTSRGSSPPRPGVPRAGPRCRRNGRAAHGRERPRGRPIAARTRRRGRAPRRTSQERLPPTPRGDRRRHRAGARPRGHRDGPRRPTPNATSSSESSRAPSASVAAIDEPRQPPSELESL